MRRRIRRAVNAWYIWLFPAVALALSSVLLYDYYRSKGTMIKIHFEDASGLQAERTPLRFRGVPIGYVKNLYISDDQKAVVAEVLLSREAEDFAVEGSKFSIVLPKVGLQGVSGLETLLDGTYISVLPGPASGARKTAFKALSNTTAIDPLDDTSPYLLEAPSVESINTGDAVTYRGLKVGSVTKLSLAKSAQVILVQINIENRYTRLVRANSVFWRKVAVDAKLSLFGSQIKVNSLDAMLNGGIELATPGTPGRMAKAFHKFALSDGPPKESVKWNPKLDFPAPATTGGPGPNRPL